MIARSGLMLITISLGALASLALWFGFELRYMWYLDASTAALYRTGIIVCLFALLAIWTFAPSRIAVGAVALVALTFPIAFGSVGINPGFVPYMSVLIALPVGVAHLSRRLRQRRSP